MFHSDKQMQVNAEKCHVFISTEQKVHVNIGTVQMKNSNSAKLLGTHLDSKLCFKRHKNTMCGKARAKISALGRVAPYMNIENNDESETENNDECLFQFRMIKSESEQ